MFNIHKKMSEILPSENMPLDKENPGAHGHRRKSGVVGLDYDLKNLNEKRFDKVFPQIKVAKSFDNNLLVRSCSDNQLNKRIEENTTHFEASVSQARSDNIHRDNKQKFKKLSEPEYISTNNSRRANSPFLTVEEYDAVRRKFSVPNGQERSTPPGLSRFFSNAFLCQAPGETLAEEDEKHLASTRLEMVKLHFSEVESRLFEMFGNKKSKTINVKKFMAGLMDTGLRADDPRLKEMYENVSTVRSSINNSSFDDNPLVVDYDTFFGIISDNLEVVVRAFSHSFVIPQFKNFCAEVNKIYEKCKKNTCGEVASYIPQLFRVKKDHWAVSIVTVDGQRYSMGDVKKPFTIQSCSKPLSYAIACADNGPETMHKYMGMEPSGRYFNDLSLDYNNKPHNPMINSGAIMTASLIKPDYSAADRFEYIFEMYKRLAGDEYLGFNNSVYLSEKSCADRNFALAYFMRENDCFPPGTKMQDVLDFYFQLCSMEITAESGAVIAATLANGGINPLNGDPVLTCEAVRNTLTLMHSCGMYNYSGEFAFKVGLPAKSGVSGCILLVVPNTLGICLWSPALDENGNSCRGTQFCDELVETFKFHHFDNLRGNLNDKIDPRMNKTESNAQVLFDLLFSVAACDFSSLRRHALAGTNLELADYDGRTALHVAASEGHLELVEFLLEKCQINPAPKDRWLRTPLDDSRDFGHPDVEKLIAQSYALRGIPVPPPVESPRFQPPKQEPYWIPRCVTDDKKDRKKDSSS